MQQDTYIYSNVIKTNIYTENKNLKKDYTLMTEDFVHQRSFT